MSTIKTVFKFSPALLMSFFLTSCQRTDAGIFELIMAILGYCLIGYLCFKISDFEVSFIDDDKILDDVTVNDRQDRIIVQIVRKIIDLTQRFGLWLGRVFPALAKPLQFGVIWIIIDCALAIAAIVFLFIGVYAKGCFGYYFGGFVWLTSAIYLFCCIILFDKDNPNKLRIGTFISFFLLLMVIVALIVIAIILAIAYAVGTSTSNSNSSSTRNNSVSEVDNGMSQQQNEVDAVESRPLTPYTVAFEYTSGSAVLNDKQIVYFDHTPSIPEIKNQFRANGWHSDYTLNKMNIYCLLKGTSYPGTITANHPNNLL